MGILLALIGAICLAVGTDVQHRGVHQSAGSRGRTTEGSLGSRGLARLLANPVWVGGTLLIGLSTILQLASLLTAPLVVVQPLGVVGLVVTAWLTSRRTRQPLPQRRRLGIALCIIGIGAFVVTALAVGQDPTVTNGRVVAVVAVLVVCAGLGFVVHRVTRRAMSYSLAGAVMFGFVATLAQVLLKAWQNGALGWISLLALAGWIVALLLGMSWVQQAHAKGTSTLVLAGLTVVDPLAGVVLTGTLFGELSAAPAGAIVGMLAAGAVAVVGVTLVQHD
ncbi:DMT family transporter [Frondihabitans australicus]|uniref:Magnesium transporter NIPA n=1 Tax=Frondihabitans australicus TaxID=386892 RepID=A0A495IF24_9MICO|nr:DMT family transporter [Frondihabitans australicus]RKR73765.1 magnesium transporter NIPA [Frondihabitans australicus]